MSFTLLEPDKSVKECLSFSVRFKDVALNGCVGLMKSVFLTDIVGISSHEVD
jgi:hypothetical protein